MGISLDLGEGACQISTRPFTLSSDQAMLCACYRYSILIAHLKCSLAWLMPRGSMAWVMLHPRCASRPSWEGNVGITAARAQTYKQTLLEEMIGESFSWNLQDFIIISCDLAQEASVDTVLSVAFSLKHASKTTRSHAT